MVSVFICALGIGFSDAHVSALPKIQGIPTPHPLAISADGKTVVGQFAPGNPFTWRGGSVAKFRPSLNVNILDQYAQSVSANGNTIVGKAGGAYVWTRAKGIRSIGDKSSYAYAVSEDGSSVACQVEGSKTRKGFIWRESGSVNLETFAPTCISGDGRVAAGIRTDHGSVRAFYFHDQVSEELPMPDEFTDSTAFAANRNGSIIVGEAFNSKGTYAALWNKGKFTKLDGLGEQIAVAKTITRDGSYIGGYTGSEAAIWTPDGKGIFLEMLLKHSGCNVAGWKFESVNGIARVGNRVYLTGWAHFNGKEAGYYASFHVN